jgi:hypothetical protein
MTKPSEMRKCESVRRALLFNDFDAIDRREVDRHLEEHEACARWAEETLWLTHVLALEGLNTTDDSPEISDNSLTAYLENLATEEERRAIEDAACRDLNVAGRLTLLRRRSWQNLLETLDPATAGRLSTAVRPLAGDALAVKLDGFSALYLSHPLAVAAAQTQSSTFQTPDGSMVITVVDKGGEYDGGPHLLEIGVRVHQSSWIGRWAYYQVADSSGVMVAAGFFRIMSLGNLIRITAPPTEHAPYMVRVEVLEVETPQLYEILRDLAPPSDSPSGPPAA